MYLEILLFIFFLLLIVDYFKRAHLLRRIGNIPLVSHVPFVGSILTLSQLNPDNYARKWHENILRFGKTFCSPILGLLFVVTADQRIVHAVLSSQEYLHKNLVYKLLNVWLGNGLLLSSGKHWQTMRKIITPAFHFKILEQFVEVFDRQTDTLIQKLAAVADGHTIVNIFEPVGFLAMGIISGMYYDIRTSVSSMITNDFEFNPLETAMGVTLNVQLDSTSEYVRAVNEVTEILANRFVRPHLALKFLARNMYRKQDMGIRLMHNFTDKIIVQRRQSLITIDTKGEVGGDIHSTKDSRDVGIRKPVVFLDVLLQSTIDGQPLSDKQIRDEVSTFMFEGHDTTSSAISFCLYALSRHAEVQNKLFAEIRNHFGDNIQRPVTYADLQEMPYLNCVIKESLRLYPPIPAIGRWLVSDLKLDDCTLPAGTNVIILLWELLKDPDIFKDPYEFIPERHLEENPKISGYSYTPFSAGPRNCIGQRFALFEIRTVIIKILRNFELLPMGDEVQVSIKIVLRSKNGVQLGLKRRNYN